MVNSHIKNHPAFLGQDEEDVLEQLKGILIKEKTQNVQERIPHEMLKKYITYSRQNCFPKLQGIDRDKISKFYSHLRNEAN